MSQNLCQKFSSKFQSIVIEFAQIIDSVHKICAEENKEDKYGLITKNIADISP